VKKDPHHQLGSFFVPGGGAFLGAPNGPAVSGPVGKACGRSIDARTTICLLQEQICVSRGTKVPISIQPQKPNSNKISFLRPRVVGVPALAGLLFCARKDRPKSGLYVADFIE